LHIKVYKEGVFVEGIEELSFGVGAILDDARRCDF
jgi:hypothetical protein